MREALNVALARLAPVPLAALDELASLQVRTDTKYVVDLERFGSLVSALGAEYGALEIEGRRVFRYDTVYFDTPDLVGYRAHIQDRRRRFKCRTRLYADSGVCCFEVKLKGGRGETVKRKLALDPADHGSLTPEAQSFLAAVLAPYGLVPPAGLMPALATTYRRVTLLGRGERLTGDFELALGTLDRQHRMAPGRLLLETKTERGNGTSDRLLRRLGARPEDSCSKYCLGVALAHGDLPDNRFRRLLRRHFGPAPRAPELAA
jgi:hypothetical protein